MKDKVRSVIVKLIGELLIFWRLNFTSPKGVQSRITLDFFPTFLVLFTMLDWG